MHADDPADLVHDVLAGALFPEHPLGREVLGEQVTVEAMSVADVAALSRRPLPARPTWSSPRPAASTTTRSSRDWPAGCSGRSGWRRPGPGAPSLPALSRAVLPRPTEQVHLAVATPAPDRDDEDRHAMSIIEHVLGGGMSSRLFQSIREERGLAYSVYSYRLAFQGAGALADLRGHGTGPCHRGPRSHPRRSSTTWSPRA